MTVTHPDATIAAMPAYPDRWRPTRAGLVALWRYWDETFTFHGGRLLLRGPNGSGKSMALELLLPFLLDADASPGRLTSSAKSRGGLYDRVMTGSDEPSRTGFAWVEFTMGEQTFTVGARIRASQATRNADVDYFTTSQAVGRDLHLLDGHRTPLSRKGLVDALGESGRVHATGDEHRTAVREALFPGFSADRYSSVIAALLALRKEKLSQHLDLAKLSETLSESLPPVDDHDIAAVAEGFERLDRRRAELAALEAEVGEVRLLAARQRDYARAVVVGAARGVRNAETQRDDVTRAERAARSDLDEVEAASAAAADERRQLAQRVTAIVVAVDALKDSDAYRDGVALADLRAQAYRLRQLADRAAKSAAAQATARDGAAAERDNASTEQATATANLDLAVRDLRAAAAPAGADGVVGDAATIESADDAERFLHTWVEARRTQLSAVRAAVAQHTKVVDSRDFLDRQRSEDDATVTSRIEAGRAARAGETSALAVYRGALEEWASGCHIVGPGRVVEALASTAGEPPAVTEAVAALGSETRAEDAVRRSQLEGDRTTASAERDGLIEERARWAEGRLVDPDGPPWRSPRPDGPGAPLWRLVDLAAGVTPAEVDGLEAALTGAGFLDAWVRPDASVKVSGSRADVTLGIRPATGRTLADMLVPAPPPASGQDDVPADVVTQVLRSIRVADSAVTDSEHDAVDDDDDVVFGLDGTYRLGSATGRGPERPALVLGSVARERHRLARLAALDEAVAEVEAALAELDRRAGDLDRRRQAVAAELAAVPTGAPVEEARRAVADAAARLGEAEARLDRTRTALTDAEAAVRAALRSLTSLAARHGLPTEAEGLANVEAGLTRLAQVATAWTRRRRDLAATERECRRAGARLAEAESAAATAAADHQEAERDAMAVEGRVTGLESSIGAEYGELLRRVSLLGAERSQAQQRERELTEKLPEQERKVGRLRAELQAAEAERAAAERERATAHQHFAGALTALGADASVADQGPLDTATAVLGGARAVAAEHEAVATDHQSVERLSERVRERTHQAQAALGARVEVARELADEGWWVLRTLVAGIRRGASELATSLAAELAEGRAELAAEEEKLFEQTLAGSVRRALADRIRQANGLVDRINTQLDAVRTLAGGVHVRLRWEVDPEQLDAVKAARTLLLRDPADLSDGERASLQAFVRARVDQARVELEANAPWEARLRETLDYRSWHRFSLLLAHRDWEGFQPATARRLQKLSTGERSIALHLPMIASVAAHYAVAGADGPGCCPRLILLDELFAGVDTANRAKLFGTFSAWDLDAVFTSDHEWCQYPALDGIAIHHLHPPTGDEPVTSTRFTWDGRRRHTHAPAP